MPQHEDAWAPPQAKRCHSMMMPELRLRQEKKTNLTPMFNNLTDRFKTAFRNLTGKGKLTEANIQDAMAEIRTA
ncbi:MAG: signal recognition particle receptor subunit alpha, partial [Victivallales bacterium]|nr:signal recognition particle receptor subunit alpha [Victivallales bacterium]